MVLKIQQDKDKNQNHAGYCSVDQRIINVEIEKKKKRKILIGYQYQIEHSPLYVICDKGTSKLKTSCHQPFD